MSARIFLRCALKCSKWVSVLATASVGAVSGYVTARSGSDPYVVAAVVSALLGGLLGWCAFALARRRATGVFISSLCTVAFALVFGVTLWQITESRKSEENARFEEFLQRAKELRIKQQNEHFELVYRCSEFERNLNKRRYEWGLEPLPIGWCVEPRRWNMSVTSLTASE